MSFYNLVSSGFQNAISIASAVQKSYSSLSVSVEHGFETWIADLGVTCGTDAVFDAGRISKRRKTPIFRMHLVAPPSHLFFTHRFAFHTWDYPVLLGEEWLLWDPRPADMLLAKNFQSLFLGFLTNFSLPYGAAGQCSQVRANGVLAPKACLSGPRCSLMKKLGFGPEFWWVN